MTARPDKKRAPRNRTLTLSDEEREKFRKRLVDPTEVRGRRSVKDKLICGDTFDVLSTLPKKWFDLVIADPPYNLTKSFGRESFKKTTLDRYERFLERWINLMLPLLKETASVYICGDWRSSSAIQRVGSTYMKLQNRITWEREKGRGSKKNWKNASEDIWFFTVSDEHVFNADAVRLKKRIIAPYTEAGKPKGWRKEKDGDFRMTAPSNLWTDLSVPFWSMPENTDHPTQKPEKLAAKIILASSHPGDMILDPFSGSGTFLVTASKLGRSFVGIESDLEYCAIAQKRLDLAKEDKTIQGYADSVFWERNSRLKS